MSNTQFEVDKSLQKPEGVTLVKLGNWAVAIYEIDGVYYATQDGCTHARASLSEGELLEGGLIACPVHGGTFHVPTGKAVDFPCERAIRTYRVVDEGALLKIDLTQPAEAALVEA